MTTFTTNFRLTKPDFNAIGWDTQLNADLDAIDSILGQFNTGFTIQGVWLNSTLYSAGITVIDSLTGHIWLLSTTYTSGASPGTFAQDRAANPTFWTDITNPAIGAAASAANALVSANNAAASFASITALVGAGPSTGTGVLVLSTGPTITNLTLAGATVLGGTLSGAGISSYLASPPAIGGTVPAAGTFATLKGGLRNYIAGGNMSAPGGAVTLTIPACASVNSTNDTYMETVSSYTKTTASWAVGSGSGMLDTGATGGAASTWYHVYQIIRPDTGVVDFLMSLSVSAPTLPTNYTKFRRIGSVFLDGSKNILGFNQNGDEFLWLLSIADVISLAVGLAAQSLTLTVPTGVKVNALFNTETISNTAGILTLFNSLDQTAVAANATLGNFQLFVSVATLAAVASLNIRTNTSAQVRVVGSSNTATNAVSVATQGWIDTRGRWS